MKGLSLTLTVIVVAVALLVTVLVIITIFGGQMASFLGILNPWSEDVVATSMCNQKCATWCQNNPGQPSTGWDKVGEIQYQGKSQPCSGLVPKLGLGDKCLCGVASGCSASNECGEDDVGKYVEVTVANTMCASTKCKVYCYAQDKDGPTSKTGTCVPQS